MKSFAFLSISIILFSLQSSFTKTQKDENKVAIWAHNSIKEGDLEHILELKVYVNEVYKGRITQSFNEMENCETEGALILNLKNGKYQIKVKGIHKDKKDHNRQQKIEWNGFYEIEGGCTIIKIGKTEDKKTADIREHKCEDTGEVGVWLHESMRNHIRDVKVYIDGNYCGNLNTHHNSDRTCGDSGMITKKLNCGLHKIEVKAIRKEIKEGQSRYYELSADVELNVPCMILPIKID